MTTRLGVAVLTLALIAAQGHAHADEAPDTSDASDALGFGDDAAAASPGPSTTSTDADPLAGTLEAAGQLAQRTALWTERMADHPLAQAQESAELSLRYKKPLATGSSAPLLRLIVEARAEYDLAYLQAHLRADEPTREAYAAQLIGRETYLALSWGAVELSCGRQIIPWGQGEMLSVVDVVSPRDLREPGLAELDELRMAVLASRIGVFVGEQRFEAFVVHESFFGLRPAPLSDFSPLAKLLAQDEQASALLEHKQLRFVDLPGRFTNGAGQLYARWSYTAGGFDLALFAASTLDKQGMPELPQPSELLEDEIPLRLWHPRYTMLGHAGAKPLGAFVVRWEASVELKRPFATRAEGQDMLVLDFTRRDQANALLALAYFGVTDMTFTLEYAQSLLLDDAALPRGMQLLQRSQQPVFALRATRSFLRETLTLQLVSVLIGVDPFLGHFTRVELDYELSTALHTTLGYAVYLPSRDELGPFYGFTRHDRLYAGLRWDFTLD